MDRHGPGKNQDKQAGGCDNHRGERDDGGLDDGSWEAARSDWTLDIIKRKTRFPMDWVWGAKEKNQG